MKKIGLLLLFVCLPLLLFGVDFSYHGMVRTRTTQQTVIFESDMNEIPHDTITYSDYRMRLFTEATFSDALNLVWGVEVNGQWGNEDQNRDEVNVKTKHLYLDFTPDMIQMLNFRVGLQPYKDIYQGAIFDEDAVGVSIMPEVKFADLKMGYFVFNDEEAADGDSRRFYTFDAAKTFGKLTAKTAVIYNKDKDEELSSLYYGLTADYAFNDRLQAGALYAYCDNTWLPADEDDYNDHGWFIYGYASYAVSDKMNVKLHYGMSPGKSNDNGDYISFMGIMPYFNPYGLEYLFKGPVMDDNPIFLTPGYDIYGDWEIIGQQVIAANITYDMFYLNAGYVTLASFDWSPSGLDNYTKSFGTELDLGVKLDVMEGLELSAVYAMFMPGDFFELDDDTAHEMSAKLQYNF